MRVLCITRTHFIFIEHIYDICSNNGIYDGFAVLSRRLLFSLALVAFCLLHMGALLSMAATIILHIHETTINIAERKLCRRPTMCNVFLSNLSLSCAVIVIAVAERFN